MLLERMVWGFGKAGTLTCSTDPGSRCGLSLPSEVGEHRSAYQIRAGAPDRRRHNRYGSGR
jgi:hypothetical protein